MIAVKVLISWGMPLFIFCYLVSLYRLVRDMKIDQPDYWRSIGNPSITDSIGQFYIVKIVVFGIGLPSLIAKRFSGRIFSVRAFGLIGILLFIVVIFMMYSGVYD